MAYVRYTWVDVQYLIGCGRRNMNLRRFRAPCYPSLAVLTVSTVFAKTS